MQACTWLTHWHRAWMALHRRSLYPEWTGKDMQCWAMYGFAELCVSYARDLTNTPWWDKAVGMILRCPTAIYHIISFHSSWIILGVFWGEG